MDGVETAAVRSGKTMKNLKLFFLWSAIFSNILLSGCLPEGTDLKNGQNITIYGFSIMKEPFEKDIFPAFAAKWKREHGEDVGFTSSFAGSETVTNQILQGAPADLAVLSIERDVDRLTEGKVVTHDWHELPSKGIINKTPFVIIVRQGNPKGIQDFNDLAKPDIKLIHPDPISSGGAQWSILAIYGSELKKSETETGTKDSVRALQTLQSIWKNVISTPGSAREARTQFETGYGDALITYELEGLTMKESGKPIEIIVPKSTIFSEHPATVIDRNATGEKRQVVDEFLKYLWSDEAQKAFVKNHFRSISDEVLNDQTAEFKRIEMPFTVEYLGGWAQAYPNIIQDIFQKQVQQR